MKVILHKCLKKEFRIIFGLFQFCAVFSKTCRGPGGTEEFPGSPRRGGVGAPGPPAPEICRAHGGLKTLTNGD